MNIKKYKTLIFDCDGVILNSNRIKTEAFYEAALPYGQEIAQSLVNYHLQNGGVSRYKKFSYLLEELVKPKNTGPDLNELLETYALRVRKGLMEAEIAKGLELLRSKNLHANWLIVSGGDQAELREIFLKRNLTGLFDGGIFGSPDSKDDILNREILAGNIKKPSLFFGDSRYDEIAAKNAGMEFVFVSEWSEAKYDFPLADYRILRLNEIE